MASLKVMQAYADKCADRLGVDAKPVLRWQTSDCRLRKYVRAHCHIVDNHTPPSAPFPRGTICISRKNMAGRTVKQWHYTIGHEVAHLAVKSNHSTGTFARRMVALGVANDYDRESLRIEKMLN